MCLNEARNWLGCLYISCLHLLSNYFVRLPDREILYDDLQILKQLSGRAILFLIIIIIIIVKRSAEKAFFAIYLFLVLSTTSSSIFHYLIAHPTQIHTSTGGSNVLKSFNNVKGTNYFYFSAQTYLLYFVEILNKLLIHIIIYYYLYNWQINVRKKFNAWKIIILFCYFN